MTDSERQKIAKEAAAAIKARNKRNADALKAAMAAVGMKKKKVTVKKKKKK
jgi:hypothetical protein